MRTSKGDFGRKLAEVMREHARLEADIRALASILTIAEEQEQVPHEWLTALKALRLESEYQKISGQYDSLISEVERASEAMDIENLLLTMPPAQYLN